MALSPATLGNLIYSNMQAKGAKGSNLLAFCNAVGAGIVMSIVGKAFATIDTGLTIGPGAGIGTGITALQSDVMKSTALQEMPTRGVNAEKLMDSIMSATVNHLLEATLVSTNTPVYLGAGIVTVGTIAVVESEMASNIDSQLLNAKAHGKNRIVLAKAIAAGVAREIVSAGTGAVAITGHPIIDPPVPGVGAGVGIIS